MAKPATPAKPARKVDNATKTVAAILQEFGREAFDIADRSEKSLQEMCDRWIAHLLLGAPSPSREELKENWFDWPGVRDFVKHERTREKSYVLKNINEYQDLALTLLRDFSASVQVEQEADGELREQIEALNVHAKAKSGEDLRQQVFATIGQLNAVLEAKKSRHRAQLDTLSTQVEDLQEELKRVRASAQLDGLTQLYNRKTFDGYVEQCLSELQEKRRKSVLLMCDIDHFKPINDNHGHPFGDEVIRQVAATLCTVFGSDLDFVARYGGEEFAVVHRGSLEGARTLGAKLIETVRALEFESHGQRVPVTISVGVAALRLAEGSQDWIARADKALYASKELGRDRITIEGS